MKSYTIAVAAVILAVGMLICAGSVTAGATGGIQVPAVGPAITGFGGHDVNVSATGTTEEGQGDQSELEEPPPEEEEPPAEEEEPPPEEEPEPEEEQEPEDKQKE